VEDRGFLMVTVEDPHQAPDFPGLLMVLQRWAEQYTLGAALRWEDCLLGYGPSCVRSLPIMYQLAPCF
jgi:hypothetical protein